MLPTTEYPGGSGQLRRCQVCRGHCHGRLESEEEQDVGGAKHPREAPEQEEGDQDMDAAAERLCAAPVCRWITNLSCGPGGALTDIRHTEAETVGAAQRITVLEVVETRLTQFTVGSHYVHLWRNR